MSRLWGLFFVTTLAFAQAGDWQANVDKLIGESNFAKAKVELNNVLQKSPQDFQALWRLSRLQVFEADALSDPKMREKGYETAYASAENAVKANGNEAAGYLRRASAAGKIALFKGVLEARGYVNTVKADAEKAIALGNGGNDIQAWSHYVLGRAHLKLTDTPAIIRKPLGLAWGTLAKAEEHIMKANQLKSDSCLIWLEVAKLQIKKKNKAAFDAAMEKVKTLPVLEPTDKDAKAEMAKVVWD